MAPRRPRRHHYQPQFYLAGFTDAGRPRGGRLSIVDVDSGEQHTGKPNSEAYARDFYRLEVDKSRDPFALEAWFSKHDGDAAPVVRAIESEERLPTDSESYTQLVTFIALMTARVPAMREHLAIPLRHLRRVVVDLATSSRERCEHEIRRAREAGASLPDVSYEKVRAAIKAGRIPIAQAEHLRNMITFAKAAIPMLGARRWVLLIAAEQQHFITSDSPVVVSWSDPERAVTFNNAPSLGTQQTDLTFPLTKRLALLSRLEEGPFGVAHVDANVVANLNSRRLLYADRFIYSTRPDFVWLTRDGRIAGLNANPCRNSC